jgi:hypothetical protein
VEHVDALVGLAVLLALFAAELDAARDEERAAGRRVLHLDEARVEVDLGRERGDRDERGRADAEDRRDGLVEEALVAVRGLLEDEHVAAGALCRADLNTHTRQAAHKHIERQTHIRHVQVAYIRPHREAGFCALD